MPKPGSLPSFPGATPFDDPNLDARSSDTAVLINGRGGNDQIWGSDYADQIYGGGGNDYIYASPNDALIDGGPGQDTVDFSLYVADGTGYGVNARLFGGELGLWPNVDGVFIEITGTIKNVENLIGSDYDDVLMGSYRVANFLDGGEGADILIAYGAGDFLVGGSGADQFELSGAGGRTTIVDFNFGAGDRIHFDVAPTISWAFGSAADRSGVLQDAWIGTYVDPFGGTEEIVLLGVPSNVTPTGAWVIDLAI